MKKVLSVIVILLIFLLCDVHSSATTYDDLKENSGVNNLYNILPDDAKNSLSSLGINGVDFSELSKVSFSDFISEIGKTLKVQSITPLKTISTIIGIMLLYSLLYNLKSSSKTSPMENVLSVCITLCITCAIVMPITSVISSSVNTINTASDFMLAYIPVMLFVMVSGGYSVSGASYYSLMIFAGQAVGQVSSNVLTPFLNLYLGLSVSSAVSPSVNLNGFLQTVSKIVKWLLGFLMTVFTALLTFRQLITTAMDSVSTRAIRFTLTSLVPVVGSALSDAYKTVQSSVGLLKSGVGIFVIFSVAIVFLPSLIQCLLWILSLNLCKSVGEIFNLNEPVKLLSSLSIVITTLFAILLCIMSVFIILTALVLLLGGGI